MLHGILVFYVAAIVSRKPKSTFKISCAQNVPKIVFFTQKWRQKRPRGNLHEALFFNGREGGIRTHGGSSPHLISSFLALVFAIVRNSKEALILLDLKAFSSIDIPCKSRLPAARYNLYTGQDGQLDSHIISEAISLSCPNTLSLTEMVGDFLCMETSNMGILG